MPAMRARRFWDTVAEGALSKSIPFSGGGTYGYAGPWGWLFNLLPGAQYDYRREAANLWENSIVLACIKWMGRTFPEAPPLIEELMPDGKWVVSPGHSFVPLIENPNPFWTDCELWAATLLSLAVDGNAYWYKSRSKAGRVVELYYVPHWTMEPRWPDDGGKFLSGYEYRVHGDPIHLPVEDVVHFRDGVDPRNYRKGLSPLSAVLREVCSDNEAATFSAALLRNMGVPGVVISPAKEEGELATEERERLLKLWQQKFAGDRRGEPLVTQIPISVSAPAFSPEQMVIDKVRRVPEERITAALGIPAIVVGMGAGLERSTYANFKEAREAAYESSIIPTKRILAKQLTQQLLVEFADPGRFRIGWDFSEVRALQESQNDMFARLTAAVGGPWLSPNEARAYVGRPAIGGGDALRPPAARSPDRADAQAINQSDGRQGSKAGVRGDTDASRLSPGRSCEPEEPNAG